MSAAKRNPYTPKFMTANQLADKLSVMNFGAKGGGRGGVLRKRLTQEADDDDEAEAAEYNLESVSGLAKAWKDFNNPTIDKRLLRLRGVNLEDMQQAHKNLTENLRDPSPDKLSQMEFLKLQLFPNKRRKPSSEEPAQSKPRTQKPPDAPLVEWQPKQVLSPPRLRDRPTLVSIVSV